MGLMYDLLLDKRGVIMSEMNNKDRFKYDQCLRQSAPSQYIWYPVGLCDGVVDLKY